MVFNLPGVLVPFNLLFNPRLVIPSLVVKDIRYLDFYALKRAGYRGAVFDKDNCLTIPHKDPLVPELKDAWKECKLVFGEGNVLVVSNSAGTARDSGEIQAEAVTYHLGVPVLRHSTLKPGYKCIGAIRAYFSSLSKPIQDHELIVVGDRIFTDIVMANRMRRSRPPAKLANEKLATPAPDGPLGIWTSGVWQKESMLMRRMELGLVNIVKRFTEPRDSIPDLDYELEYTRPYVEEAETVKPKRRRWGIFA